MMIRLFKRWVSSVVEFLCHNMEIGNYTHIHAHMNASRELNQLKTKISETFYVEWKLLDIPYSL